MAEEAEDYLRWLEAKVAASIADGRPTISHDEAMKRVRAIIEAKALKTLKRPSRPRKVRSILNH